VAGARVNLVDEKGVFIINKVECGNIFAQHKSYPHIKRKVGEGAVAKVLPKEAE